MNKIFYRIFSFLLIIHFVVFIWYISFYTTYIFADRPLNIDYNYSLKHNYYNKTLFFDYGDKSCAPRPDRKTYVELFQTWANIARDLNIHYFLTKGTLLAVLRDEELFPWDPDNDIDILMLHNDTALLEPLRTKRPVELFKDDQFRIVIQEEWRKLDPGDRTVLKCDNQTAPGYSGLCGFRWLIARAIKGRAYVDIYEYKVRNGTVIDNWHSYKEKHLFPLQPCRFIDVNTLCPYNPYTIVQQFYGKNLENEYKCRNKKWNKKKVKQPEPKKV